MNGGGRVAQRGRPGRPRGDKMRRIKGATAGRVLACGLLVVLELTPAPQRWVLSGDPAPPSAADVAAAAGQVSARSAALDRAQLQVAAANAKLAGLEGQAELLIERYDQTVVAMNEAAVAYRAALARLAAAERAQAASHQQVIQLATQEYQTGGGFGAMTSMLGDAAGPQAFLDKIGLEQVFAGRRTDTLAGNQAASLIAGVFRAQARDALYAEKADVSRAAALKVAVQAAVARQLAAVRTAQATRG